MKRSAKVWSQDSILAATLYWYQAATTPARPSAASAPQTRVRGGRRQAANQRHHADDQVDQALHHAPGAGRHVERMLGDQGDADGAEAEQGDQA